MIWIFALLAIHRVAEPGARERVAGRHHVGLMIVCLRLRPVQQRADQRDAVFLR